MDPRNDPTLKPPVDETRRRLAKAGLAAPAVLGVLASRPVLGNSLHNCTPSGYISGFASPNPNGTVCSTLGKKPQDYANTSTWPNEFKDGNGVPLPFNQAPSGVGRLFLPAYIIKKQNGQTDRIATVEEVLKGQYIGNQGGGRYLATATGYSDDNNFTLGKEAIAAAMNAVSGYPSSFPISPIGVVDMFNSVIMTGGKDKVTSTNYWDAAHVIAYFQSLHST